MGWKAFCIGWLSRFGLIEAKHVLFPRADGGVACLTRDTLTIHTADTVAPAIQYALRPPVRSMDFGGAYVVPLVRVGVDRSGAPADTPICEFLTHRKARRALSALAGPSVRRRFGWATAAATGLAVVLALSFVRSPPGGVRVAAAAAQPTPSAASLSAPPVSMPTPSIAAPRTASQDEAPALFSNLEEALSCDGSPMLPQH